MTVTKNLSAFAIGAVVAMLSFKLPSLEEIIDKISSTEPFTSSIKGHNELFSADFQVLTLVQVLYVIHCLWIGSMGILCTIDPSWSPITENGVFERVGTGEKFVHPNVRGGWNVRGGSMFIVTAGALYFGTRETYLVTMAAAIWREGYDCIELLLFKKDGKQIVFRVWKSPFGPQPPLVLFFVLNVLAFWAIVKAA